MWYSEMKELALKNDVSPFGSKYIAMSLRIQSLLTAMKIHAFMSLAIFFDILSINIMERVIPTLPILYSVATLFGAAVGYYGFRDMNYYLSSFYICMIITQFVILGFMFGIVNDYFEITNYRWNLSLLIVNSVINTYLLGNAIWCILDFPIRLRDDSKLF